MLKVKIMNLYYSQNSANQMWTDLGIIGFETYFLT